APSSFTSYKTAYNIYKNNMFIANGGTNPYAIYLPFVPDSGFLHYYQINSNNYYSSGNLGYTNANRADLAAWQSVVVMDSNSISKLPDFLNPAVDLRLSNYVQLYCLPDTLVGMDIRDSVRHTPTQMGCYENDLFNNNGSLSEFSGMREGVLVGVTDTLKLIFTNNGTTTLNSVNLGWSINGSLQSSKEYFFSKPLPWLASDTIDIATLTYFPEYVNVQIWINSLNGGTLSDELTMDDTVSNTVYICTYPFSGVIPVSDTSNYTTIDSILNHLSVCGLGGDVTLLLDNGIYAENCDFSFLSKDTTGYKLSLTSKSDKAEDVVIKPASGTAVTLSDVGNFVLKSITIDATVATTQAMLFTGSCRNILVRDCRFLGNLTTTATTNMLVNTADMGVTDSIFFINNLFNGGYQAVAFKGGIDTFANGYGTNFIFDSNTVSNQYMAGVNLSYLHLISCSYNTITSRTTSYISGGLDALTMTYVNGTVVGNRIIERNTAITFAHGIDISYHNAYPVGQVQGKGLIANNEIILTEGDNIWEIYVCRGMMLYNSKSEIIHNSIYITAGSGGTGIQIYGTTNDIVVRNNNIAITGSSTASYPISLTTGNQNLYDIDYNNFYAGNYVGYYGTTLIATIAAWQQRVTTDTHSVRILPKYIDVKTSLELSDDNMLYCDLIPSVNTDINGTVRKARTAIGCYEENLINANAILREVFGLREGVINGETETLKVVLTNRGAAPLSSINLGMLINGTTETSHECYFNSPLLWSQTDTVDLTLTYIPGNMTVKIWINSFNNGTLLDGNPKNDTLSASTFVCPNTVTGNISIGKAGDYTTITSALQAIAQCGYGEMMLLIDSGLYAEICDLSNVNRYMPANKLTITSKTGKAEDVVIKSATTSGARMKLSNTRNVVIKNITIDATTATNSGISFSGSCRNILIRDCRFLGHLTTTSTANVLAGMSTGEVSDSIFFINNLFNGGYRALNFKGGIGTGADQYGTNFIFDSNTVINQYHTGVSLSYLDLISCSHNTISSRTANVGSAWCPLVISYINGPVIGNKITSLSSSIYYPQGINVSYHNCYPVGQVQGRGLIANNEISFMNGYTFMNVSAAIMIDNTKSEIIHNSIYTNTTSSTASFPFFGIYIPNLKTNDVVIKNNNIVITGKAAYPISFTDTGSLSNYDMDYNNYYNPEYVGYYQEGIKSLTTWRKTTATDIHSVSALPSFMDLSTGLNFADYNLFHCNLIPAANTDINGYSRNMRTIMGCYEETSPPVNAALTEILGLKKGAALNGESDNMKVVFINKGNFSITSATLKWSINGQLQPSKDHFFNPPLTTLNSDTIDLAILAYTSGEMNIKIWIDTLDGGTLIDGETKNDTISISVFACNDALTGIIPVSDTSVFSTITSAITAVAHCGVGDITLVLDSGLYEENCDFSNINRYISTNKLTLTSKTGKAENVVIKPTSGAGITLANTHNLVLKAITVDV
ncbi:MAG: hypothetical protein LBE13_18455, partial [Bacteroidales bacterium]|nr:hypothetical protein [Bacteroidales bacterium]